MLFLHYNFFLEFQSIVSVYVIFFLHYNFLSNERSLIMQFKWHNFPAHKLYDCQINLHVALLHDLFSHFGFFLLQNNTKTQTIWLVSKFSKLFSKLTSRVQKTRFCCAKSSVMNLCSTELESPRLEF